MDSIETSNITPDHKQEATVPEGLLFGGKIHPKELESASKVWSTVRLSTVLTSVGFVVAFVSVPSIARDGFKGAMFLLIYTSLAVTFWFFVRRSTRNQIKHNRTVLSTVRGFAGKDKIRFEWDGVTTETTWGAYLGHKITPDLVLLHQTPQLYNLITRPLFANDEDWQAFLELVREKTKPFQNQPKPTSPIKSLLLWIVIFLATIIAWQYLRS